MEFNVASPFEAITGSDVFLDGSLPYPTATVSLVVLHNTTSQSTDNNYTLVSSLHRVKEKHVCLRAQVEIKWMI
jgi:hypothetical protein